MSVNKWPFCTYLLTSLWFSVTNKFRNKCWYCEKKTNHISIWIFIIDVMKGVDLSTHLKVVFYMKRWIPYFLFLLISAYSMVSNMVDWQRYRATSEGKRHRANQGSNFLEGCFNNRDIVRAPVQFRREGQSQEWLISLWLSWIVISLHM